MLVSHCSKPVTLLATMQGGGGVRHHDDLLLPDQICDEMAQRVSTVLSDIPAKNQVVDRRGIHHAGIRGNA